jgi:hypothetical protein
MRTRCCRPPWGCPRLSCNPKTGNTKAWQGAASCGLAPALPPSPACIANQLTGNLLLHADSLLSPSLGLPPATLRMALPRAFLGWLRRAVSGGESWGPGEGSPEGVGEWGQGGARASGKGGGSNPGQARCPYNSVPHHQPPHVKRERWQASTSTADAMQAIASALLVNGVGAPPRASTFSQAVHMPFLAYAAGHLHSCPPPCADGGNRSGLPPANCHRHPGRMQHVPVCTRLSPQFGYIFTC